MTIREQSPASVAKPASKTRALLVAATSVIGLAALLVAAAAWTTQASPRVVPTRVLIDGSRGQGEVLATIEADYQEPASWHGMGIKGGSCVIATSCASSLRCPVLRAAVRPPRPLGEGRVAIDAVVTELWPARAREALEADGAVECTFAAYVDLLKTGWRVEREVRWSLANTGSQTVVSVTPQKVTPKVQDSMLVVNGSYLFEAQLAPGSALAELLRSVPVVVRAEFGYVEQQEGALHAGLHMDTELNVTTQAATGKTVVTMPFATTSSASLKTLAKYMAAVGKSEPESTTTDGDLAGVRLHNLVFAAAPHAPATASLFGDSHQVAWSRNFSFTQRSERRLGGRRLLNLQSLLPQDIRLMHRFQIDAEDVLEVVLALSGAEPAEATLVVRSGAAFTNVPFKEVFSFTIRTDELLKPKASMGDGADLAMDGMMQGMGNVTTKTVGSDETVMWKGDGMAANMTTGAADYMFVEFLLGEMTGSFQHKAGALTGTLISEGSSLANLTGTITGAEGDKQRVDATVKVGEDSFGAVADIVPAAHAGGSLTGSLTDKNGVTVGSADVKLEATASGDVDVAVKVVEGTNSAKPMIDAMFKLDATEPTCGVITAHAKMSGEQLFSADVGCKRTAGSEDFQAHAKVSAAATDPALVDASMSFVSTPVFGGDLKAEASMSGSKLFTATVKAAESGAVRSIDGSLTMGDDVNEVKLQFSKPDVVDVQIDGSLIMGGTEFGKASVTGKAIDHVVGTQMVEGRKEFFVANPGTWGASLALRDEEKKALGEPTTLTASLAQAAEVMTLEVTVPSMIAATIEADSTGGVAMSLKVEVSTFEGATKQKIAHFGGTMMHKGDTSSGQMSLNVDDFVQKVDLTASRGFLAQPDSTYKMSMSASAMIKDMGMDIRIEDAYMKQYADGGMAGVGWGLKMMDSKGAMQLMQGVDLGMAPPPVDPETAIKVVGSMSVQVEGDVEAFVKDPAVKRGFQTAIAETVGVPMNRVKVLLSAARRLSETRRLAGAVKVDYEILVPQGTDSSAVSSTIAAAPTAELATKVMKVVEKESGGSSPYTMTITEVAAPVVYQGRTQVTSRASGARGMLPAALLAAAASVALAA